MLGTNFPETHYLPPNQGRDMLAGVAKIFEASDIVFGNLEGVLLDSAGTQKNCRNPKICYLFRSPDYMGARLQEAGFNLLSVANNHSGDFGAEGIGLCRTEHMFFDADRIVNVRQMILAEDRAGRMDALAKLLPVQKQDFIDLFTIMRGLPVTVRLLDPPLHEFLPQQQEDFAAVAKATGSSIEQLKFRADALHETNPMLGHRGCRLGISYPEIYEMQARAIIEAALEVSKGGGAPIVPEIMIPLVGSRKELEILKVKVSAMADEIINASGQSLDYMVGTMIELPRAALQAGEIAKEAEFFSFGTNDLTQTTYGISRDDSASFLDDYVDAGIFAQDPFVTLDQTGVGELVKIAVERGRATRPEIKLGICGEHGGDPASVEFCHGIGLDYVSCSPYRVPIARLAAAQAKLKE
ncbi:MAG: CapA family protein [Emcibacter sp.]|nr:CapA family protein [Emcibacter sp.]